MKNIHDLLKQTEMELEAELKKVRAALLAYESNDSSGHKKNTDYISSHNRDNFKKRTGSIQNEILELIQEGETISLAEIESRAKVKGLELEKGVIISALSSLFRNKGAIQKAGRGLFHRPLSSEQVVDTKEQI